MAKKSRMKRITLSMSAADVEALGAAGRALDRPPAWILLKLGHLAAGTIALSVEVRRWLRGDTAFDAGLPGDQKPLMTIENPGEA